MKASARSRARLRISSVLVRFVAEGCEATGLLKSASRGGLFIEANELPHLGSAVVVQFESPVGAALVNVRGEVRWTTRGLESPEVPTGFGVLLHEPPREYREFFLWAMARALPDASLPRTSGGESP